MDIRDTLRMAVGMADTSNKVMEQSEKCRADIVRAVKWGADREEIRKLLDEHYKKVYESFNIYSTKKAMKEAIRHSDTATDSAFTQAITALKEADEKKWMSLGKRYNLISCVVQMKQQLIRMNYSRCLVLFRRPVNIVNSYSDASMKHS